MEEAGATAFSFCNFAEYIKNTRKENNSFL